MSENGAETMAKPEFMLNFLQGIMLNKLFRNGYKLELEELVGKNADDNLKPKAVKKQKNNLNGYNLTKTESYERVPRKYSKNKLNTTSSIKSINENSENGSNEDEHDNLSGSGQNNLDLKHKRSLREKKPSVIEDIGYIEKDKSARSMKNPISTEIFKKCEKVFSKLKRNQVSSEFMNSTKPDVPCLSQIEKTLRSYSYQSVYQFGMDVRRLIHYYFTNFKNNQELYNKTFAFSNLFEMLFKEIDVNTDDKNNFAELNKKLEKLTKEIKEIDKKNYVAQLPAPMTTMLKKTESGRGMTNIMEKPMSMSEKNQLGNSIRLLTQEQLRGVINIVSDNVDLQGNSKFFEFDIETLATKKLRELEKFVKSCIKTKGGGNSVPSTPKSSQGFTYGNGNGNINGQSSYTNGYNQQENNNVLVNKQNNTNNISRQTSVPEMKKPDRKPIISDESDSLSSSDDESDSDNSSIKFGATKKVK